MRQTKPKVKGQKAKGKTAEAACVMLLLACASSAATLTGAVLDAVTGQPIPYAAVNVRETGLNAIAEIGRAHV